MKNHKKKPPQSNGIHNKLIILLLLPLTIAPDANQSNREYLKSKLPPKRALFTGICGIALIGVGIKTIKERNINSQHFEVLAEAVKGSKLAMEYQQIAYSLRSSAILYGSFNIAAGLVVIYDAWQHMKNTKKLAQKKIECIKSKRSSINF